MQTRNSCNIRLDHPHNITLKENVGILSELWAFKLIIIQVKFLTDAIIAN